MRDAPEIDLDAYGSAPWERELLVQMIVQPGIIPEVSAMLVPAEFSVELHQKIYVNLLEASAAGRTASIEAALAGNGEEEIEPGVTLRDWMRKLIESVGVSIGTLPWRDSAEEIKGFAQRARLSQIGTALTSAVASPRHVPDIASEALAGIDDVLASARAAKRTTLTGQSVVTTVMDHLTSEARPDPTTGFADLDSMIGGWPTGQMSVVAGRPGMGKSALATSSFLAAAKSGVHGLFFSLEMTGTQIGARLLCDLAYTADNPVHYDSILQRRVDERARRRLDAASERLASLPLTIEEQRGLTVGEVAARATKHADSLARKNQRLGVIFVDHMLLLRPSSRYSGNRVREVAEISDGLTTLAKDLGVSVVALCQLNRGVEGRENKRATLSDLRDSGAIEEDASAVVFLYRAAYYLERERHDDMELEHQRLSTLDALRNVLEIGVAKNRNGRVGGVTLYCDIGANACRNATYGSLTV